MLQRQRECVLLIVMESWCIFSNMMDSRLSNKPDYSPLLEPGMCRMDLDRLQNLCVNDFDLSSTRPYIIDGLRKLFDHLMFHEIEGELWVDGSFLTSKINPGDVDLVLRCSASFVDNCSDDQKKVIKWLNQDLKTTHYCHVFVFYEWPEGHANFDIGNRMHDYWLRWFGTSRDGHAKGIAVLTLGGGIK